MMAVWCIWMVVMGFHPQLYADGRAAHSAGGGGAAVPAGVRHRPSQLSAAFVVAGHHAVYAARGRWSARRLVFRCRFGC